jgi:hypothetical protein
MARTNEVAPGTHLAKLTLWNGTCRVSIPLELVNTSKLNAGGFVALVRCEGALIIVPVTDVSSPENTVKQARASVQRAIEAWYRKPVSERT